MEEKIVKSRRCSEKMFRRGKHMKLIFGILDGIHMNEFYLSEAREYFRKIGWIATIYNIHVSPWKKKKGALFEGEER